MSIEIAQIPRFDPVPTMHLKKKAREKGRDRKREREKGRMEGKKKEKKLVFFLQWYLALKSRILESRSNCITMHHMTLSQIISMGLSSIIY